jgi:hypothetical protein
MHGVNHQSVIYPLRAKPAPDARFGAVTKLGAVLRGGGPKPACKLMRDTEKWMELCALAAEEQDPKKFLELTQEIIRLY